MKKIIAILLVLVLIVSLVGCGKKKRQIIQLTLSTEDSEAILKAAGIALPAVEDAKGANTTVKWLAWYDEFHNYSEDEIVQTGFWTFQQKYNCDIEWIECDYFERMELSQPTFSPTPRPISLPSAQTLPPATRCPASRVSTSLSTPT